MVSSTPQLSAVDLPDGIVLTGELQRLTYQPDDVFVFMAPMRMNMEQRIKVLAMFNQALPGCRVIVLDDGCRLGLVSKEVADGAH